MRIFGSFPAESCLGEIEKKLKEFDIYLERDIVAATTDGAAVMKKVGRLLSVHHQLCYAHGLQLAVCDVLYKKTHQEEEGYLQEESGPDLSSSSNSSYPGYPDHNDSEDEEQCYFFSVNQEFPAVDLLPSYR